MRRRSVTVARVLGVALGMLLPLSLAVPAEAASVAGSVQPSRLTPEQIAQLSAQANEKSIIVLKNQHPELPPVPSNATRRAQAVQTDQAAITGELQQLRSPNLHSFQIVNAVGATISQAEVSRLRTNPVVEAVVPDAERTVLPVTDNAATPAAPATPGASPSAQPEQVCPPNPQVPLVEPEALQLLHVQNQTGDTSPAAHDLVDGTGVKVGIIADGLDVNNPDLTRKGKSIVYDFQDFSGDGPGAPTDSREAFLDAGSIAAQGNETYDLSKFVNPAHPLPAGCNIKIEGVAPGTTLAIMNVFGGNAFTYDSNLLMGIDHAVSVDKVDVLNESFGGSGYPDDSVDPVKVANENAVAAGVTVVASTGDAGPTSTIGTPATDPGIIAAGGSTALQIVRELNGDGSPVVAGGWLSDNMSDIGSSGTSQYGPRTVDVVAPADRDWTLCSTDIAKYTGCADLYDNHLATLPIWAAGGTSVSAPLTSGTAALVIEAYEKTHHGQHPTPALVKQIIMGSATDLEAPANHQGAGLVNALKAVQTAESLTDGNGSPKAIGDGLVASQPSLSTVASAGSSATFTEQVTNTSPKAVTVTPQLEALNANPQTNDTGTVQLGAGDSTFVDASGLTDRYQMHQFTVPQGTDYLTADIGWNAQKEAGTGVLVSLFDPAGRFANYSPLSTDNTGRGHSEVRQPMAGTWTALVSTVTNATEYTGAVTYTFQTEQYGTAGTVTPQRKTLAPGQTGTFTVGVAPQPQAGDFAASLRLHTGASDDGSVPVLVRSLIPTTAAGGGFSGTLIGGASAGQNVTYQFDVPAGRPSVNLSMSVASLKFPFYAFLVDPNGEALDIQSTTTSQGAQTNKLQFFRNTPQAGRWSLIIFLPGPLAGGQLTTTYHGAIDYMAPQVTAQALPQKAATVLPRGKATTATLVITNRGNSAKDFFADPRLPVRAAVPLLGSDTNGTAMPITGNVVPNWLVPSLTDQLIVAAEGSTPLVMTVQSNNGDPNVLATSLPGNFAVAQVSDPELAPGFWDGIPMIQGPFSAPATGTVNLGAVADTYPFDPTVVPSSGDVYQQAVDPSASYTPVTIQPGQSGTITLSIRPTAPKGTVVKGFVEVETFDLQTASGDEVQQIPYTYTVG